MSKFLTLGRRDLIRSLILAAGTALFTALMPVLQAGSLPNITQLKTAGIAALIAACVYLGNNVFTNSKGNYGRDK